jgi:hypothetical protein
METEIETIEHHIESGALVPSGRVSADNLEMAATWLEAYEGEATDPTVLELAAVAAWIRREVARRRRNAARKV